MCFDLCAFAGTIVSCKPIFSSQIWDIYVNSYICCSWAAANAEHSLSFLSDTASVRQGTWQSGYLPPFAVSNILLLQHQLCAGFSTLLSSQCKYYEQRYSPWTTPERLIWDAFPFLFGLSFFPIVLSVCLYIVYLFIYLFVFTYTDLHATIIRKSCGINHIGGRKRIIGLSWTYQHFAEKSALEIQEMQLYIM